jgi:septum site-determining protein MinC
MSFLLAGLHGFSVMTRACCQKPVLYAFFLHYGMSSGAAQSQQQERLALPCMHHLVSRPVLCYRTTANRLELCGLLQGAMMHSSDAQDQPDADGKSEEGAGQAEQVAHNEDTSRALARRLLKGTRSGLLLTLAPGYAWAQVLEVLTARLEEAPAFFHGALLSLDTRARPLQAEEVAALEQVLERYAMTWREVRGEEPSDLRLLPGGAGRGLLADGGSPDLPIRPGRDATDALLTRRTVRAGQRLRYAGSVVILGDVNAGGEVIAGGDVLVWGMVRGMVHAGYPENERAVICALGLAPVQLRIGGRTSRPPEDGNLAPALPEVASVQDGQIVVESWNVGRARRR